MKKRTACFWLNGHKTHWNRRVMISIVIMMSSWFASITSAKPTSISTDSKSKPAPTVVELALNWKAEPEFGGFFAAVDILKKENIELKIIEGGSSTPTVQMLAAKTVPLAVVGGDELMTARERGMDVVAFFSLFQTNPHALMVREDSPWKSIEDILNDPEAIVSVNLGLPYVAYLKKKLPQMKAKLVPYQGGVSAFLAQKKMAQQCFVSAEPLLAKKSGVKTRSFPISQMGFDPYLTVVAVRGEYAREQRELLKTINLAFRKGWKVYFENPKKYDEQMNRLNPSMTLDIFKEAGLVQRPFIQPNSETLIGSMTAERWQTLGNQLKDLKLLKGAQSAHSYFIQLD